jgi:CHAD domain-containing protein
MLRAAPPFAPVELPGVTALASRAFQNRARWTPARELGSASRRAEPGKTAVSVAIPPGTPNSMSYRLDLTAPVPDALRATALERLERAAERLREDHGDDPVKAVHGARKDLKMARALLRLARPGMPAKAYRAENRRLRDLGLELSGSRDADVMVETADAVAGALPGRHAAALHRRLAAHPEKTRAGGVPDGLAEALSEAVNRAAAWPVDDADAATLRQGAERAYRRGRKQLAAAVRDPFPERLHEWRKRVKDLWYHHPLLRDAWKGPMKAYTDEYDELGGTLGDDHDLAVLAAALKQDAPSPSSVDLSALLEAIAARRGELRRQAFAAGRHGYAEKPKAFGRRLGAHLAASDRRTP